MSNGSQQACIDFIRAYGSCSGGVESEFVVFTSSLVDEMYTSGYFGSSLDARELKLRWHALMLHSEFVFGQTYRRSIFEDYAQAALTVARQIVESGTNGEAV